MREGSRIINYWAEHLKGGLLEPDCNYIMTLTIMRPNQEQPGHEKIANTKRKIPPAPVSSWTWDEFGCGNGEGQKICILSIAVNIFWQIFSFNESNFNCLKSWNWEMMRKPIICGDGGTGRDSKLTKARSKSVCHQRAAANRRTREERETWIMDTIKIQRLK